MRHLADLLGNDHPLFARNIAEMEKASGNAGIDTALVGEIIQKSHEALRQIGIDSSDCTAEEAYHALNSSVASGRAQEALKVPYLLLRFENGVVSLNLQDVIENSHHQLSFGDRKIDHGQRHLRMEIVKRYAEHERTHEPVIRALAKEIDIEQASDHDYKKVEVHTMNGSDKSKPTLLAIGDIFTDAFIKLDENYAKVEKDEDGNEWLKLPFGAKPPYEQVDIVRSVGPSPNAAVSFARLGLNASMMAWVGGDEVGKEAITHLNSEGISTDSMVVEDDKSTSYWYVLRHGADRTMLVKSETYRYEWQDPETVPDWIYLAYIGKDSWPLHEALLDYLERNPSVKFVFQPATYHFEWGPEKLAGLYKRAHLVVMNREEAMQVTGKGRDDIGELANGLHELGPEKVVITDGSHGSYASFDWKLVTIPNYPDPKDPVDRTGAGDAFASTIVAGLALGKSMEEALTWAPINSMNVVQEIGAQKGLLTREKISHFLDKAPEDYKVTQL
ncbi:MAG TPA: carbohydrate kinase family protein [Candidatus Saccharimonadales bacterium]